MASKKSKRTTINRESADRFSQKLEQLPEKPKTELTPKELIFENSEQIDKLLEKGYSYDDLVSILKEEDIHLSKTTLRQYLSEARKAQAPQPDTQNQRKKHLPKKSSVPSNNTLNETPKEQPTVKKARKGRLNADENSARYSGSQGEPIEMNSNL